MSYYAQLIDTLGPRPVGGSPLVPKLADIQSRIHEAHRLTQLLEAEHSFSLIRLGEMELAMYNGNNDSL